MEPEQMLLEAEQLQADLLRMRRALHQIAETGFDLPQTVALVKQELKSMGLRPVDCGQAGVTALVGGKRPGAVFLLRADMDALPIAEETELPFAAQNGHMHACGHDLHTAMLLGAARLLKAHERELAGTVRLMFQPAEELLAGAQDMLAAEVLEDPPVEAALMLHVMTGVPLPAGTVVVSPPGVGAPAADYFEVQVQGEGCHGSMPHTGVDPLLAAAHILVALQEIQTRELPMGERAVLTVGSLHAGDAANAIPDTAVMAGSLRAFDEETRAALKRRLTAIAEGIAASFRAKAVVRFTGGCPTLVNDPALAERVARYADELLREGALSVAELRGAASKTAGSEDFAYVSHKVPSIMLALAAGEPERGYTYPLHHPMVQFDETVLPRGSAVYAYTALRWLQEQSRPPA